MSRLEQLQATQVERIVMRLSASQIQTFTDCQRKWAWKYVEGVEEPPNASAQLGGEVHKVLESYLLGGQIDFTTELGYIAASGLEHLPKPGTPGLLVEQEFHFEGPSGHTYLGYKDLEEPALTPLMLGIVYDHKTTSDLKWQKTEEQLRVDIQATLYAVDYFRKNPEHTHVELRWVYYQTKNTKKSAVTKLRVNQTETWNRFLEIEKTAEAMAEASTKRALDLAPSINHCSAYGGCPHQGRCNLSPFEKMRSHVEQNKLTALLKSKKNGAAAAPVAPPVAPPQTPLAFAPGGAHHGTAAAAVPLTANKLLTSLQARGAPTATSVAPVPPAINPPEYQPPPASAEARAAAAAAPASVEAAGRELAESLAQGEPAAAEVKRGRGRPSKAVVPETGIAPKIKTLYVNCGPVGVPVVDASHFIAMAKSTIAQQDGLADYRFAEFGQGPGLLAGYVVAHLTQLDGMLPALRLDTTTPEGGIILNDLVARAELVVR